MTSSHRRDLTGLIDQGIVSATTLLSTTIFIRGAGMEEFGIFSLVMLVLLFATAIQHAAVVAPAYAILPKLKAEEAAGFRGWLALIQLALLSTLLLILAASWAVPGLSLLPHAPGLVAALLFLAARQCFTFLRLQLFTEEAGPKRALLVDAVHGVLSIGALSYIALNGTLSARTGLFVLAGASFLASFVAVPGFLAMGCRMGIPSRGLVARHAKLSKWLVGKALAQWFTANSFLTALGAIQGPAALGAVRAAQTLIGVAGVVIQGYENLVPSRAASAFAAGGIEQLRTFMRGSIWRWYRHLLLCLLPIVAFPDLFLRLLTGRSQAGLEEPLYLFALGAVIALGVLFLQVCLRSVERVGVIFWAQLSAGIVGAIAAVPVTVAFGIRGCIIGMLVQQLIVLAFLSRSLSQSLSATSTAPDPHV